MLSTDITLQKPHTPTSFNTYLVTNKCAEAVILSKFSRHYLRKWSPSDTGVFC